MADALFLGIAVLTIGGAIAALELRSLIYGSIALMGMLGGIAGFFIMLDSPFVAMFQIAVYVCLLYTSPSPRDGLLSRMPSSA